jgi:hypothetical protein
MSLTMSPAHMFLRVESIFRRPKQIILFAWIAVLSGFLAMRSPSTVRAPERAAVTAP